jgi:hypothetical protein
MKKESANIQPEQPAADAVTFEGITERLAVLETICNGKRAKEDGRRLARGGAKRRTPLWLD